MEVVDKEELKQQIAYREALRQERIQGHKNIQENVIVALIRERFTEEQADSILSCTIGVEAKIGQDARIDRMTVENLKELGTLLGPKFAKKIEDSINKTIKQKLKDREKTVENVINDITKATEKSRYKGVGPIEGELGYDRNSGAELGNGQRNEFYYSNVTHAMKSYCERIKAIARETNPNLVSITNKDARVEPTEKVNGTIKELQQAANQADNRKDRKKYESVAEALLTLDISERVRDLEQTITLDLGNDYKDALAEIRNACSKFVKDNVLDAQKTIEENDPQKVLNELRKEKADKEFKAQEEALKVEPAIAQKIKVLMQKQLAAKNREIANAQEIKEASDELSFALKQYKITDDQELKLYAEAQKEFAERQNAYNKAFNEGKIVPPAKDNKAPIAPTGNQNAQENSMTDSSPVKPTLIRDIEVQGIIDTLYNIDIATPNNDRVQLAETLHAYERSGAKNTNMNFKIYYAQMNGKELTTDQLKLLNDYNLMHKNKDNDGMDM